MYLQVLCFSSKRFSLHLHLKEEHTELKLLSTQIPFPHLCRSRDHVCQARGQACYSCKLLQTELKETPHLSLKGMQNILAFGDLLLRIKSDQYCRKKIASQVESKLHRRDHHFHTNLQMVLLND